MVVLEAECTGDRLYEEVEKLLADSERRKSMRQALLHAAVPDSAERICDRIINLARK